MKVFVLWDSYSHDLLGVFKESEIRRECLDYWNRIMLDTLPETAFDNLYIGDLMLTMRQCDLAIKEGELAE